MNAPPQVMFDSVPKPAPEDKDRLSGRFFLHHQHCCVDPVTVEQSFSRILETTEQPFVRRIEVGEIWKSVSAAWLEQVSFVVIQNPLKKYATQQTDEQKALDQAKIVEFSNGGSDPWLIRPNSFFIGEPSSLQSLQVRCQQGTTEIVFSAIPK